MYHKKSFFLPSIRKKKYRKDFLKLLKYHKKYFFVENFTCPLPPDNSRSATALGLGWKKWHDFFAHKIIKNGTKFGFSSNFDFHRKKQGQSVGLPATARPERTGRYVGLGVNYWTSRLFSAKIIEHVAQLENSAFVQ